MQKFFCKMKVILVFNAAVQMNTDTGFYFGKKTQTGKAK